MLVALLCFVDVLVCVCECWFIVCVWSCVCVCVCVRVLRWLRLFVVVCLFHVVLDVSL